MRMMPVIAGVVLAVSAACGGNGNGDETASGRAIEPEAQNRAESINLMLADFPNGWRASPSESDESAREKTNKCMGIDYSGLTRIGDAESKDFATGESTEASSHVVVFKEEEQAEDAMQEHAEGMSGDAAQGCFQDLVEDAFRENGGEDGFKLGDVDVGELSFTPPDVAEGKAWQIVILVEITSGVGKGFEPSVYLEELLLREGDAIAILITQDVLSEFDHELRDELAQTLAGRMKGSGDS